MKFLHTTMITKEMSPMEIAEEIYNLSDKQQCELINCLGEIDKQTNILAQLFGISSEMKTELNQHGKWLLNAMFEYFK